MAVQPSPGVPAGCLIIHTPSFDDFVEQEQVKDVRLFWHGSRNENWWSIINTGLVLRPTNAVITGKMFGYGIYQYHARRPRFSFAEAGMNRATETE